jgi:hypothetical protein
LEVERKEGEVGGSREELTAVLPSSIDALVRSDATKFTYLELATNFSNCRLTSLQGLDVFTRLRNVDLSHNNLGEYMYFVFVFVLFFSFFFLNVYQSHSRTCLLDYKN